MQTKLDRPPTLRLQPSGHLRPLSRFTQPNHAGIGYDRFISAAEHANKGLPTCFSDQVPQCYVEAGRAVVSPSPGVMSQMLGESLDVERVSSKEVLFCGFCKGGVRAGADARQAFIGLNLDKGSAAATEGHAPSWPGRNQFAYFFNQLESANLDIRDSQFSSWLGPRGGCSSVVNLPPCVQSQDGMNGPSGVPTRPGCGHRQNNEQSSRVVDRLRPGPTTVTFLLLRLGVPDSSVTG